MLCLKTITNDIFIALMLNKETRQNDALTCYMWFFFQNVGFTTWMTKKYDIHLSSPFFYTTYSSSITFVVFFWQFIKISWETILFVILQLILRLDCLFVILVSFIQIDCFFVFIKTTIFPSNFEITLSKLGPNPYYKRWKRQEFALDWSIKFKTVRT